MSSTVFAVLRPPTDGLIAVGGPASFFYCMCFRFSFCLATFCTRGGTSTAIPSEVSTSSFAEYGTSKHKSVGSRGGSIQLRERDLEGGLRFRPSDLRGSGSDWAFSPPRSAHGRLVLWHQTTPPLPPGAQRPHVIWSPAHRHYQRRRVSCSGFLNQCSKQSHVFYPVSATLATGIHTLPSHPCPERRRATKEIPSARVRARRTSRDLSSPVLKIQTGRVPCAREVRYLWAMHFQAYLLVRLRGAGVKTHCT